MKLKNENINITFLEKSMILVGFLLIIVGIIILLYNILNNDDGGISYKISISKEYQDKVIVENEGNENNFYYTFEQNGEKEEIFMFVIKPEVEIQKDIEEGIVDNVELIGEFEGIKYYSATRTDIAIDPILIQDELNNPDITEEERKILEEKLKEYNNFLEIYQQKDKIIEEFRVSK